MDPCPCLVWAHCLYPDPLAVARRIGGNERKWKGNGEGKRTGRIGKVKIETETVKRFLKQ